MNLKNEQRSKDNVAQLILEAAMTLFVEKGIEKTSMRNIAERIGYSPANVYLYFKNKAEIMYTLHQEGFRRMRIQFEFLNVVSDPVARLKALGKAYLKFSAENPGLYGLMFSSPIPMEYLDYDDEEVWREGFSTFAVLKDTVKECMEMGKFAGHELEATSFMIWSTTHGMASLANANRITKVKFAEPETVVARAYAEFERMIDRL